MGNNIISLIKGNPNLNKNAKNDSEAMENYAKMRSELESKRVYGSKKAAVSCVIVILGGLLSLFTGVLYFLSGAVGLGLLAYLIMMFFEKK